jgi:ribose transport system substrate-binding protein
MTDAMQATAAANNASVKMFNANNDPSTQLSQCKEAISSGTYQAIVLYPVDGAASVPCAVQAIQAHIPVIPVDSPVGPDPTSTKIQVPGIKAQVLGSALAIDANAAVSLVKQACSHFPAPCTVVQTEAIPAFFYSTYKVAHEQPALKALGYKILATPVIGNFDNPDGTKAAIQTILAKDHSIDVILSDDDSSVQGAVQLKRQGMLPHTLIIGDGGSSLAIAAIKQGNEFGTSFSVPRSESSQAVLDALALVRGQSIAKPNQTQLDLTSHYLVTKANVAGVTPEW